ncbi:MAG: hypothetical protein KC800_10400, partial [Candidatus Eremiobacteraeota bacterium]|nr:hypothetical protein [Candidatus Eremiobacteraeota bacterium]
SITLKRRQSMDHRVSNDTDQLWASLSNAIERETPPDLNLSESEVEQKHLLSDRLAASYLSGFWPLVLFCVLIIAVSGQWGDPIVRIPGVLLTLVVAFLCRPLVRSRFGGTNLPYLACVAPLLLFLIPVVQLLPASVVYHLTAQLHERYYRPLDFYLAESLQSQFESIFQPLSLIVLALGLVLLCASVVWLRRRFPWLEHLPGTAPGKLVAALVLLSPWVLAGLATLPDTRIEQWTSQIGAEYQQLPVGRLEKDLSISFWQDLESRFERECQIPTFSPDTKVDKENLDRFRVFETEILAALKNRKPASLEEATACLLLTDALACRAYLLAHPIDVAMALESEQFHGIRYQYSDYIWRRGVIRWLNAPERTPEELDVACEKLSRIQDAALPYLKDYDFTVYSVLTGDRYLPRPPRAVFRSVHSKRATYLTSDYAAKEMHLLGARIEPSPTEILVRRSRLQFVEQWLEMRPKFQKGFEQSEKSALAQKEDDPKSLSDYYQGWIAQHAPSFEDRALRETTIIYSRLLAYRARRGNLPADLGVVGVEETGRWRLETDRGVTVLVDRKLEMLLSSSPWSFQ